MRYISKYYSPLGEIILASDGSAITGLWFTGQKYFGRGLEKDCSEKALPVFDCAKKWLDIYFSGREPDSLPPLKLSGTPFQKEVWALLLKIPYGSTTTYGELAKKIADSRGLRTMSSQAVGGAVGHNPVSIIVPCHRVLGADGSVTGYAGGVDKKLALLRLENKDVIIR